MRALLIRGGGVIEIDVEADNIKDYYHYLECDIMTSAGYLDERNAAYVDDNGLLTLSDGDIVYRVSWYPQPLAGNILILGIDHSDGSTQPCTLTTSEVHDMLLEIGVVASA